MTDKSIEIRSTSGRRSLRFHSLDGDHFTVSIDGDGPRADKSIWGYTDCELLVQLFASISRDWRGWHDQRTWASIEGDLRLSVSSDKQGHITIAVTIRNFGEDDWQVDASIFTEAGQLEHIARQVAFFFG